jgi:hypothetical protein
MTRRFTLIFVALVFGLSATAFAAAPVVGSPARAPQTEPGDDSPLPVPPWQEGVLMLGPASFQVRNCMWAQAYLDYEPMEQGLQASFRVTEGYPFVSVAAPIHLPKGAQIVQVKVDYFDTDLDTEPSMGVYGVGSNGQAWLFADTSGMKGFAKGPWTVTYVLTPAAQADVPIAYEFLATLNRSLSDVTVEHALYRVEIRYRYR